MRSSNTLNGFHKLHRVGVPLFSIVAVFAVVALGMAFPRLAPLRLAADTTADPPVQTDKVWLQAKQEVDKSVPDLLAQHESELNKGVFYRKLIRGNAAKKQIAITFDDGPHPAYTPKLLSILKQNNVKATFFLVGEMAEKYPDLVKAEMAAGHDIGNHTYHHVNLTKVPIEDVATEIQACGDVLKGITGRRPVIFRPPGGDYNKNVADISSTMKYTMILWTDDPGDYASPGDKVIETRLLDKVSNGGIILIHDGIRQTVDVLPQLIKYLKSKGYELVTIDEMMKARTAEAGVTHGSIR